MAEYYLAGTLKTEPPRAAEYYTGAEAGKIAPRLLAWRDQGGHLAEGGTVAVLRRDISPEFAARLGIADPGRPLTQGQIANLLNATRLDGSAIAGRKKHTATRSVAEVFGLDPKQPPSAEAIRNVLAGKRADGGMPQSAAGKALPAEIVEGARKRFKAALDIPAHREATRRGTRASGERRARNWPFDRYGGLSPANPRHAPAGRVCRHDVFGRQVALGRLGLGADRGGTRPRSWIFISTPLPTR